ncbi:predicted protein [Naegleria gruberi]|uniref:Predicted protein n=1 Tax=Naegleria gruberi TaxID=5762 RepID=D2V8W2_NAEGR|nr:uncharacterized protein NAEGRDRAFT_65303 [Naegleria gruberi]EFC46871.1 predicted protein [Naegleria gruberi]|eukprot:XP_002679615.1 predicted protein [Naegleria gruberi strain NEG-M]
MSQLHPNNEQASDKSKLEEVATTNHDASQIIVVLPDINNNSPEKTITRNFDQPTLVSLPPNQINSNTNNNTINNLNLNLNLQQQQQQQEMTVQLNNIPNNSSTNNNNIHNDGNIACSPPITTNDHPLQPNRVASPSTVPQSPQQPQQQQQLAGVVVATATATTVEQQGAVDQKQENSGKKKKKKRKEDYDDDDTENDLLDNDLDFTPDELELLKSQDPPPISFDLLSEIPQIPAHLRTRLTILQQQQIIYSLHSLNLTDKQRKELMLLGNVMKRITQDELMKCSIFESVNVYLFILCVSTLAAAVGTLALALIYFVVLKDAVAEGTFSIVLSAIFTITLVGCILLCIVFNIKNRPKHKFRKSTLAHYHEVFEEAIYDIGIIKKLKNWNQREESSDKTIVTMTIIEVRDCCPSIRVNNCCVICI